MLKRLWLVTASLIVLALAGSPKTAIAGCLMNGSTCVAPSECCSNRCMVGSPNGTYGKCDPLPDVE